MLPTRDPLQDRRPTQTESEGLETNFPSKWSGKRAGVAILKSDKLDFKKKGHKERPRRSLHNTQRKNPPRRHKHCKLYTPNIGASKYIKKILEYLKKDIDSNTIIVGDFNTPLSKMDRSSKQNIKKDNVSLKNTLDEMALTDIYRAFHPKEAKYTFFSSVHGSFSKIDLAVPLPRGGFLCPACETASVLF